MIIRDLSTNNKVATVTFNYDELRCVNSALFHLSEFDDVDKDSNFDDVRAKFIELFALVKCGKIPEFELKQMYRLMYKTEVQECVRKNILMPTDCQSK